MLLTFRRATEADYDVILSLDPKHEIYKGEDYLPSQLHRFLIDPEITVLLGLHEESVVSGILTVANWCFMKTCRDYR